MNKLCTFEVEIKKIEVNHDRFRDDTIKGISHEMPIVGKCFEMQAPGVEFGTRLVNTSQVTKANTTTKVVEGKIIIIKCVFSTQSGSIYEVKLSKTHDEFLTVCNSCGVYAKETRLNVCSTCTQKDV